MQDTDISKIIEMLKEFHGLYSRITAQQIVAFLTVASNNGEEQTVITRKSDIEPGTSSKHLRMLSTYNTYKKKPGFGLIQMTPDPLNGKTNTITITKKGKEFIDLLSEIYTR